MEIRIVIFLAFVSVSVIFNALVIFFAYKVFANLTLKLTATMAEFQKSSETRQWIESMQVAADRAAVVSESTKRKFAEFDPALERVKENYRQTLVDVDAKLEKAAENINSAALKVRDTIAKPAFSVVTFAAGVKEVLRDLKTEE